MTTSRSKAPTQQLRIVAELVVASVGVACVLASWQADRGWYELHITENFCATEPRQLHALNVVRCCGLILAAILLFCVRPLVGRWAKQRSGKEAIASIARIVVATLLAVVVSDLAIRAKRHHSGPGALTPEFLPPVHAEPHLGWISNEQTTTILRADGRDISYAINAHGFRARTQSDLPNPTQPSILFAGESFAEGLGVFWKESYPALVGADLKVQTVESAVHGYGNDQAYLAMQSELQTLSHPLAVVTILVPQQLSRDLDVGRNRLVAGPDGALRVDLKSPAPTWWTDSPVRKLAHSILSYHSDSSIPLVRALIAATVQEAEARGAYPLFVMTNWGAACLPGDDETPALAQRLFHGQQAHWIEVPLDPSWVERTTYHPNPAAHRVLADAIDRALVEAKVVGN